MSLYQQNLRKFTRCKIEVFKMGKLVIFLIYEYKILDNDMGEDHSSSSSLILSLIMLSNNCLVYL